MDFLSCKNSQERLGVKSLFNWVLKKLSVKEMLVEFAIRIWNVFTLTFVIINIIIFIISHHRWRRPTYSCNLCHCPNNHRELCCWHTSPSCICISQGGWLPQVLGEVWLSKLDWALGRCSMLVADTWHGELLDVMQPVSGSCCDLACFLVNNHLLNALSDQISVLERTSRFRFHCSEGCLCHIVIMLGLNHREPRWKHSSM